MSVDAAKIEAFVGQVVADMSAGLSGVMTNLGHKLGLYKAMAGAGPMTPAELARKTRTHERYVREWLNNQAAGGYVDYDPRARTYSPRGARHGPGERGQPLLHGAGLRCRVQPLA